MARGPPAAGGERTILKRQVSESLIAVYLVTYHRHEMLRRALASVIAQTHRNLVVRVVNDDPYDGVVAEIVEAFADTRVTLFKPLERRGATRNFNLMFADREAEFVSLLEDDNWWEPTFLATMAQALARHPDQGLVVGNERIWRELSDGSWRNTGQVLWAFRDVRIHTYRLEEICGSAKLS